MPRMREVGLAHRGRARLQHMRGSRVRGARHPWDRGRRVVAALCGSGRSQVSAEEWEVRVIRRLVGVDLGIASAHTARVLAEDGREVCRRRCEPTVASLARVEAAALAGTPAGTVLEVVMEPTGPAWLPVAVFFTARGHRVFRVSSAKAADLRRFLSRHAKSNGIDADTLARLPLVDPAGLHPLELPGAEAAALDRRVRVTDRLTVLAARHKTRIKDLTRQLLPCSPLTGELGVADLAVLERWADPRALLAAGPARLTALIVKASHGKLGAERAQQWRAAAVAAVELYADHPAIAWMDLAAEVGTEVRLLRATQAELAGHAQERETAYSYTRSGWSGAFPAGSGRGRRLGPGRRDGPAGPLPDRGGVQVLHRAGAAGIGDREHRPQGPTDEQGRFLHAADHPDPGRRQRPPAGPATGQDLLHANGRTRRRAPQGGVRGRWRARRTGQDRDEPADAVRHLRYRRHTGHPGTGETDHRAGLHRPRRGPPSTPQQQDTRPETGSATHQQQQGGKAPQQAAHGGMTSHTNT